MMKLCKSFSEFKIKLKGVNIHILLSLWMENFDNTINYLHNVSLCNFITTRTSFKSYLRCSKTKPSTTSNTESSCLYDFILYSVIRKLLRNKGP